MLENNEWERQGQGPSRPFEEGRMDGPCEKYRTRRGKTLISVGVVPNISPSGSKIFCGCVNTLADFAWINWTAGFSE
jgi:hypothetical protein